MINCSQGWKNFTGRKTNLKQITKHDNMPAKKTAKKSVKKVVKEIFSTKIAEKAPAHQKTWNNVHKTDMKKPRTWADWSARQLDDNKLK